MKKGGGKGKGSSFERWVAKELSLWLTNGEDSTQFVRSALSGGWAAGLTGQAPWRHVGDLAPNGVVGDQFRRAFAVECKHHKRISLWDLWSGKKGSLVTWWEKIVAEVEACGVPSLQPLLVFRSNFMPVMVMFPWPASAWRFPWPATERPAFGNESQVAYILWMGVAVMPFDALLALRPEVFSAQLQEAKPV